MTMTITSDHVDLQYNNLVSDILKYGEHKTSRGGKISPTIDYFGVPQLVFDLRKGFPLIQSKKVWFRAVYHELLWMLSGSTNVNDLKTPKIWEPWQGSYGNLGPVYGAQWRRWENVQVLLSKDLPPAPDTCNRVGSAHVESIRKQSVINEKLYSVWDEMLRRCYDPERHTYEYYGAKGVRVCERWHSFENFVIDAQKLEGWLLKLEYPDEYQLDKDFYGGNQYHPDNCIWLSKQENVLNRGNGALYKCTRPDGSSFQTANLSGLCSDYNLDRSSVTKVLNNKRSHVKDWQFDREEIPEPYLVRVRLLDQIRTAITQIKYTPDSRRIIVSAWNPVEIEQMALPPCHCFFQFSVSACGRFLDLKMYQRSADTALGVPFNIASYALLLALFARETGLTARNYIHTFGSAHIYDHHADGLIKQINRPILSQMPQIELVGEGTMWDYIERRSYKDIRLLDYNPQEHIDFQVDV